ncbi:hypothetical protein DFS34DRAFT_432349 [Phlyctochytrium arcticum]|nr:hypothetical protein DFS34DRAFT_432349 [Phlyctochytrium arcticum]
MGPKQVWNPDITLVQKPTTELPAGTTARGTAKICSLTTMNEWIEPREQTRTGFLSRLPKYVIRNGQVVTVREGIAALLDNSPNSSSSSPTPSVSTQPIPVVIHIPHCPRTHPTKDPPATLRITSPDREYVVWARERHLVGDIMAGLETYIGPRDTWELRTAWERGGYPPDKSLQECGLTPNARMYIKERAIERKF